jgi:hypothetical protein
MADQRIIDTLKNLDREIKAAAAAYEQMRKAEKAVAYERIANKTFTEKDLFEFVEFDRNDRAIRRFVEVSRGIPNVIKNYQRGMMDSPR